MPDDRRLMLIDGHALIHRAFHALPPLSTSSGELTNAVFGFASMVLKAIETLQPSHIIMAMDRPVPTFRHLQYGQYKATRPPTPQPLVSQFARAREVAEAMNISIYEVDGFEADDVLGTLARQADEEGVAATIVTGDLDALQLVNDDVHVLTARRGIAETALYTPEEVRARYGLAPGQLTDWKGLVGDTSDNIPGVPGIGEKTATKLLAEYGSLEGLYEHVDDLPYRTRKILAEHRDSAFESRRLATIVRTVPVQLDLESCSFRDVDRHRLLHLLRDLEFNSLIDRVQNLVPRGDPLAPPVAQAAQLSMFPAAQAAPVATGQLSLLGTARPEAESTATRVVSTVDDLRALVAALRTARTFAVDTETTSTDPLQARLVGFSFATDAGAGWYLPVGHADGEQVQLSDVLDALRPLLESEEFRKVGHNLKYDYQVLHQHGITMQGMHFDTMLAAYLVNPTGRNLSLSAQAMQRLNVEMTPIEHLIGKGKSQITMDLVDIERVAHYAGPDADIALRLHTILAEELERLGLMHLFRQVEMPLVPVLGDMELRGVAIDTRVLDEMSGEMAEIIGNLEGRIYDIAGQRFNINSTQQLGQILFGQLGLPSGRKTKTGFSTDSEVLENLRGRHEIVDLLLEYRQLVKLKNTYVDALPSLISQNDGRIHTDFNQSATATGRLSSSSPNLQNIPIRGEEGRKIRKAFVSSYPGGYLLAADYSQIELRILASMSGDALLTDTFRTGNDVHQTTAAAVFGVEPSQVTPDQRRIAKVVNFGIIYGIGEQRLAYETGISRQEAAEFIANYNRTYAGVKSFMDTMRKQAAFDGYVSTLLGRRRPIPDIHSNHPGIRQAAERAAINMPIQGTNADIIKLAMIRLHADLHSQFPRSHMILQVHDELVFDVPREDLADVAQLVKDTMEHAFELSVPVEVELKAGRNWYNMEPLNVDASPGRES